MSTAGEGERQGDYVGRIARGASISTFGMVINQTLRFFTQVALARMYGATALGFYVLGTTTWVTAIGLAQFGTDQSMVRYVAEYRAKGDAPRMRGTILLTLGVTFALSLLLAGLMFLSAGFLANEVFDEPFLEAVIKAFAPAVPLSVMMSTALLATQGLQTMKPTSYVSQILRPATTLVLILVFYFLGAQILGAIAATVLSAAVGCIVAFLYLGRMFPKLLDGDTPPIFELRKQFNVAVPMGVVMLTRYAGAWGGVAIVGILASVKDVAIFSTAARTGNICALVLVGFSGIFNPIISTLYSTGLLDDLGTLYQDVCRWIFGGSLALCLPTMLLAKDILAVFGKEFVVGWPVVIMLAGAQLFSSSVGPTNRILAMTGRQVVFMLVTISSTVIALVGSVVLVPSYGAVGAGVATATGVTLFNAACVLFVRRVLGVWPYNRHFLKPLAAGALAAAGVLLARSVLTPPEGLLAILILGSLFLLAFVALTLSFGVNASDRRFVESIWGAARQMARRGG